MTKKPTTNTLQKGKIVFLTKMQPFDFRNLNVISEKPAVKFKKPGDRYIKYFLIKNDIETSQVEFKFNTKNNLIIFFKKKV